MDRLPTGCNALDKILKGGYEKDTITIIYGPGGSGKTNLCLLASISAVAEGKKAIYIDTEGGFSISRLKQMSADSPDILKKIFFMRPTTFRGQKQAFMKLKEIDESTIGIIIIDTIAMLYRLEIGKSNKVYDINRELGQQIMLLSQIARLKRIPVLITNQVYSAMDDSENIVMVGGDLLRYQSKCLIELKKFNSGRRAAILRKHRSLPEDSNAIFRIVEEGISSCDES